MAVQIRPPLHDGELRFIAEGVEDTIASWEGYTDAADQPGC